MAYTPINWQTGQTITAEKLNKMDNGWGVESSQILSETVTTTASPFGNARGAFAYSEPITAATIIVTFNGTEYTCQVHYNDGTYTYGDNTFTTVPFVINSAEGDGNYLVTPEAGTYTVAISAETVEVSADFEKARGYWSNATQLFSETVTTTAQPMGNPAGQFLYSEPITADTITVIFDGTSYTCKVFVDGTGRFYRAPASTPFVISSTSEGNYLKTETAGTYTVAVSADSVETSSDFKAAVGTSVDLSGILTPLVCYSEQTTFDEMFDAMDRGRMLCFFIYGNSIRSYIITEIGYPSTVSFIPENSSMSASFVDGIFTLNFN